MNVAAPNSVNYSDQLPLGIESKSQRKLFFPSTGDQYSGDGNNICRIDVSYDGLCDFQNSYLSFEVENKSADGHFQFDLGQPLIQRLRIECGGVVLEDIQNYNHLVAGILVPSQNGQSNNHWDAFNATQPAGHSVAAGTLASGTSALSTVTLSAAASALLQSNAGLTGSAGMIQRPSTAAGGQAVSPYTIIDPAGKRMVCYKLISGLLDNDKYIPTVLLNAPITIEITFAPAADCGVFEATKTGTIDISKLRYVVHTIDLERSFYDRLRMVQQNSGGVLQIAGTSFRNYSSALTVSQNQSISIPARLRSIKSIFWKIAGANTQYVYGLSAGGHAHITSYQIKIGGNVYPPSAIIVDNATNKVTPYLELQKSFGKLGSTVHSDLLSPVNYLVDETGIAAYNKNTQANANPTHTVAAFAPFGLDLEAFRHEIENGVDTSSKALPMSLELGQSAATAANPIQIFVMYDSLFYVNMDGTIAVST